MNEKPENVAKDKTICVVWPTNNVQTVTTKKRVSFARPFWSERDRKRATATLKYRVHSHVRTILVVEWPGSSARCMYHFFVLSFSISVHIVRRRSSFWFPNDMVIYFFSLQAFRWLWLCLSMLLFFIRDSFFYVYCHRHCLIYDLWPLICMCCIQTHKKFIVWCGHFGFSTDDHGQYSCSVVSGTPFTAFHRLYVESECRARTNTVDDCCRRGGWSRRAREFACRIDLDTHYVCVCERMVQRADNFFRLNTLFELLIMSSSLLAIIFSVIINNNRHFGFGAWTFHDEYQNHATIFNR